MKKNIIRQGIITLEEVNGHFKNMGKEAFKKRYIEDFERLEDEEQYINDFIKALAELNKEKYEELFGEKYEDDATNQENHEL